MVNRQGISFYDFLWYLIESVWFAFISIFAFKNWNQSTILTNWTSVIGWITIAQLFVELIPSIKKIKRIVDFRVWLLIFLYIFMLGKQIISGVFRIDEVGGDPIFRRGYDNFLMLRSSLFILLAIHSLFFGLFCKRNRVLNCCPLPKNKDYSMYNVGVILSVICFICELIVSINNIVVVQSTRNAANASATTGLFDDFALLLVPSLLYVLASGVFKKKTALFLICFFLIYYSVIMVLTGDRRYPAISILVLFLAYYYLYDGKIKFKHIFYVIAGLVLLNIFTILRNIRHGSILSVSDFVTTYFFDLFSFTSTFSESLNEFGISFYTVCLSVKYFPEVLPYKYGLTFILPIFSILPIGFLFSGAWYNSGRVADPINALFGTTIGGSMLGDLYGNWGIISIPILFIFGLLLSKMNALLNKNTRLSIAIYFAIFFSLISMCRATIYEVMRPFVWSIIIPYVLYRIAFAKNAQRNQIDLLSKMN